MQHDSSSVLAMATNTLHNALCITLNLFENLRLRIAIVRSAWRQPNISNHTPTVSCDLVLKIFLNVLFIFPNFDLVGFFLKLENIVQRGTYGEISISHSTEGVRECCKPSGSLHVKHGLFC